MGEYYAGNDVFLGWMKGEPKFRLTIAPCSLEHLPMTQAKRFTRLYIPRTFDSLASGYDALVLEDFCPFVLETSILDNFARSVEDVGLGIALIEFAHHSGPSTNCMDMWARTTIYDLFPADVDLQTDVQALMGRTFYRIVHESPFFDLPDIEKIAMNAGHHGDLHARLGSVVEAEWRGRGTPALVTGEFGRGRTLQLAHGWDNIPHSSRSWEYLPDYTYHQILFISGVPVPLDLQIAHKARELFVEVRNRRVVTISTLEFMDRFGANIVGAERKFAQLEDQVEEAKRTYLANDPEAAAEELHAVLEQYPDFEAEMVRSKEKALFWIYVIEWCVVSATSTTCGIVVWSLMVRRALYREAETTRLAIPSWDSRQ